MQVYLTVSESFRLVLLREEKKGIAMQDLLPRQMSENGVTEKDVKISDPALVQIISQYTRESGVRNLERELGNICRKVARKIAEGRKTTIHVTPSEVAKYLGPPRFLPEEEREKDEVGVATGLAWTETGGDILYIEATTMKGKGGLTLTGHLGEVMKESAQAALSYVRSRAPKLGIKEDTFGKTDIHIHVPAGAIPKDGPSAGVTMATALTSALTGRPVSKDVAMTGEVTLRGRVLPIGGLKEKTLAARRAGLKKVIIPKRNAKDLEDIPKIVKKSLQFVYADHMDEVLDEALIK